MTYKAKLTYQNIVIAKEYDNKRFSDAMGRFVDRLEKQAIVELIKDELMDDLMVVDIPCGTGRLTELLEVNGCFVVGADISKSMLQATKNRMTNAQNFDLILCDAENLPIKKDAINVVVSLRLMGHVPPSVRKRMLPEFARITKDKMIIAFYNSLSLLGIAKRIKRYLNNNLWFPVTVMDVVNELTSSGLTVKQTIHIIPSIAETFFVSVKKLKNANSDIAFV